MQMLLDDKAYYLHIDILGCI